MNSRISEKQCVTCGLMFYGGSTALYCSTCRAERIRKRDKDRHKRGPQRKIGSTARCEVCGDQYLVDAGPQKFCKKCQPKQAKERRRESFHRCYHGDSQNRERILEYTKKWASEHKDRVIILSRNHYLKNHVKIVEMRRIRTGLALKPLGREEKCPKCKSSYIVTERNQRYCDSCQPIMRKIRRMW